MEIQGNLASLGRTPDVEAIGDGHPQAIEHATDRGAPGNRGGDVPGRFAAAAAGADEFDDPRTAFALEFGKLERPHRTAKRAASRFVGSEVVGRFAIRDEAVELTLPNSVWRLPGGLGRQRQLHQAAMVEAGMQRSEIGDDGAAGIEIAADLAPLFREQNSGAFVHMTSTSALVGNFGQANYMAAKMGIVGLSRGIALDMQRFNVRSNCIAPFTAPGTGKGLPPLVVPAAADGMAFGNFPSTPASSVK